MGDDRCSVLGNTQLLHEIFGIATGFVAEQIESFFQETNIEIVTSGKNWLIATTEFYRKRKDKQWSGVDCFSMLVMESKEITDVLTTDKHFQQAGFNVLMVEP